MDEKKESNGDGFRLSFRPRFNAHISFDNLTFVAQCSRTFDVTVIGITTDMVLVLKHHTIDSFHSVLGVSCNRDGVLNIKLDSVRPELPNQLDFTIIAL